MLAANRPTENGVVDVAVSSANGSSIPAASDGDGSHAAIGIAATLVAAVATAVERGLRAAGWDASPTGRSTAAGARGLLGLLPDALVGAGLEVDRRLGFVASGSVRVIGPPAGFVARRTPMRRPLGALERRIRALSDRGHAVRTGTAGPGAIFWRAVIAEVLEEVLTQVDLDTVVERVDLDAVVARIDLDSVAQRLDVNAIAERIDIEALIARMDMPAITRQVVEDGGLDDMIRATTSTVSGEMIDTLRMTGAGADRRLNRIVDALLLRKTQRDAADPGFPGGIEGLHGALEP